MMMLRDKAVVTVEQIIGCKGLWDFLHSPTKLILLELVSAELDPSKEKVEETGLEKDTIKAYAHGVIEGGNVKYEAEFKGGKILGRLVRLLLRMSTTKKYFWRKYSLLVSQRVRLLSSVILGFTQSKTILGKESSSLARTGPPPCPRDHESETKSNNVYVPRDECFSEVKQRKLGEETASSLLHALNPSLWRRIIGFPNLAAIDQLFDEGMESPPRGDRFFWLRDEEFVRQTLAGINPYAIKLVTEWPLQSKLDPDTYGPPESTITKEMIECEIKGYMTLDEKVRELKSTTLYGSPTLFLLNPNETLRPLAIELSRPPLDGKPQFWKKAYEPCGHSTGAWLWRLAKTHVLAHDSLYHQLVTHCSVAYDLEWRFDHQAFPADLISR
ncbi:hypothetical protein POUND7_000992 [Theobroma cacao]